MKITARDDSLKSYVIARIIERWSPRRCLHLRLQGGTHIAQPLHKEEKESPQT